MGNRSPWNRYDQGISNTEKELTDSVYCTFCGVADRQPHGIGVEGKAKICPQCVLIVQEIVNNEAKTRVS